MRLLKKSPFFSVLSEELLHELKAEVHSADQADTEGSMVPAAYVQRVFTED